jgi:propionyl-CoA carboxylase beta chain
VVPQISLIMGPVRGRGGLFAGDDRLHLHGEGQLLHVRHRPGRGEDRHQRGRDAGGTGRGGHAHHQDSASPTSRYENDIEALLTARDFFDFLPLVNRDGVPVRPTSDPWDRIEDSLDTLIPANANQPYDMHEVMRKVLDEGDFFEIQPPTRATSSCGFGRSRAAPWAWWPTSRWCWRACSTSTPARRPRASCGSAMPSKSRS